MPAPMKQEEALKIIGEKIHRLTITRYLGTNKYGRVYECLCECGKLCRAQLVDLRSNRRKSCGCWRSDRLKKHGEHGRPEYTVWKALKSRCQNKRCQNYKFYGARGIRVCHRWNSSFAEFFKDMGPRPSPRDYIDRVDNNKDYACGQCEDCHLQGTYECNCRWTTPVVSANNSRRNHLVTAMGQTHTIANWERITGIPQRRIQSRLSRGWSEEDAVTVQRGSFSAEKHPKDSNGRFI